MKRIFITYGDDAFKISRERIAKEARALNYFDEVIVYTPQDLSAEIASSPAMAHKRGGGYWIWKPYIIWATLQRFGDDAVVFYADAGCYLRRSPQWSNYFDQITQEGTESIVFQYSKTKRSGILKPKIRNTNLLFRVWTKRSVIEAFRDQFESDSWLDEAHMWGGFVIVRNRDNELVSQWYELSRKHHEYFCDSSEGEQNQPEFREHRHDQILLSIFALLNKEHTAILPEFMGNRKSAIRNNSAIFCTRIRDKKFNKLLYHLNRYIWELGVLRHRVFSRRRV